MHPEVHLQLHRTRAAELHRRAALDAGPRGRLRSQVGWALVGVGLRMAASAHAPSALPGRPAAA